MTERLLLVDYENIIRGSLRYRSGPPYGVPFGRFTTKRRSQGRSCGVAAFERPFSTRTLAPLTNTQEESGATVLVLFQLPQMHRHFPDFLRFSHRILSRN
jgi:hypothetical protein